jgi:hypothetical protein
MGRTDGAAVRVGLCEIEHGPDPTPDFVSTLPMKGREEQAPGLERDSFRRNHIRG